MVLEDCLDVSAVLKSGIYILCAKGKVVYVGQSKCMLVRAYSHRNTRNNKSLPKAVQAKGIAYDEIHIRPCHPDQIDALEIELINKYKPVFNTQRKTSLPVGSPFTLNVGGIDLLVNAGSHPTLPRIERRI
jgi:hypothetical protein